MDETPGHAAENPEPEPDGGALPPRAGDRPLHEATQAFLDDVIQRIAGRNPMERIVDDDGNVVGLRIMPGRPADYDTYLDRAWSQRNMTYDEWAAWRRIRAGDPHAVQAPRLDTPPSEPRLRVRRVTVMLDPGDQTFAPHTVTAWAVIDQHDPHWPTHEDTLVWIGFDRESAEHALHGDRP